MGRDAMRWGLRAASAGVAALGAYVLYLGLASLWLAVQVLPGPWNSPMGLAAIGGLYLGGLMGAAGFLFAAMGSGLLAAGWYGMGLPRPWRRGRPATAARSHRAGASSDA